MKKIFKYLGVLLSVVLVGALTSCNIEEIQDSPDLGLGIKVFFPTKVVAGQPMTINGSGFKGVSEVVFPDGISVTDFEIVSDEMIRVTAPSGISAAGGNLIVRTSDAEAVSGQSLTLGKTVVSGYSKQAGESAQGGEQITIFGEDLEFINAVELLDMDGNPNLITDDFFYRKGTSSVIFYVPRKNIFKGTFAGKVFTYDGREFDMPELAYEPSQDSGHWETVKTMVWENNTSAGAVSWSGQYRFAAEGRDGNNECIAEIPQDIWDKMKSETFYLTVEAVNPQVRVTTGWWSAQWPDADIQPDNENAKYLTDNGDGTFTVEVNLAGSSILDLIDEQHLLFTGDRFTLLDIYFSEEVWIEGGGHFETVKTIYWENDGTPIPSWGGTFRFGLEGNDGNNECIATFPADVWDIIKEGTVRVAVDVNDASNIRITTGWWSAAYGGGEHNCIDMIQEEEDGTKYIELNIKGEGSLYDLIDEQHLLFTGDAYTLLYIYTVEEVWIGGGGGHWERKSFWKNDGTPIPAWGGTFRFGLEGNDGNNECIATFPADVWDIIKNGTVRVAVDVNDASNIRITTGWWSAAYGGGEHNCIDMIQEEEDGTKYIELNIKGEGSLYDLIDEQHLLFTGDAYTLLEIYVNEWVEGGDSSSSKPVVMWENDGTPIPSWGGTFRFSNVETQSGEQIYAFPMEDWAIIKDGKFRAAVDVNDASNIRITTGWWSAAYGGAEHNCIDMIQEEADGTKYIEIDIKGEGSLYDVIDEQHLLFTGDSYTLLKLYYYK